MVTDFSGTLILSNEFVVMFDIRCIPLFAGQVPTTWGYFWVRAPNVANVATGGKFCHLWLKKWLKKPKSERNDMELRYVHHLTRLNDLIILVWSNVKIG